VLVTVVLTALLALPYLAPLIDPRATYLRVTTAVAAVTSAGLEDEVRLSVPGFEVLGATTVVGAALVMTAGHTFASWSYLGSRPRGM